MDAHPEDTHITLKLFLSVVLLVGSVALALYFAINGSSHLLFGLVCGALISILWLALKVFWAKPPSLSLVTTPLKQPSGHLRTFVNALRRELARGFRS